MKFGAIIATAACFQSAHVYAEENWNEFNACVTSNLSTTDIAEPSIHGGADLIVDVLCVEQSTWLINAMILNRDYLASQSHLDAFESDKYIQT